MNDKKTKFEEDLNKLIFKGKLLLMAINFDCRGEKFRDQTFTQIGEEKTQEFLENAPDFRSDYQTWYTEAHAAIRQILPDRLKDFESYFEYPRVRKAIDFQNYMIRDYLQGLGVTRGYEELLVVDGSAAIPEFDQQLNIVKAARDTLNSSLMDMTAILQADLFDTEVDSARALAKAGYRRAAGAICGVVIEKHLKHVCDIHNVIIKKKNPGISDLNQALKDIGVLTVPQWRFNQHLGDIRNLCDHAKDREPTKEEIEDLVTGTEKVLKTVF